MLNWLKQLFCRHEWVVINEMSAFGCISGGWMYRQCRKCGKIKRWIYVKYEGSGYK